MYEISYKRNFNHLTVVCFYSPINCEVPMVLLQGKRLFPRVIAPRTEMTTDTTTPKAKELTAWNLRNGLLFLSSIRRTIIAIGQKSQDNNDQNLSSLVTSLGGTVVILSSIICLHSLYNKKIRWQVY